MPLTLPFFPLRQLPALGHSSPEPPHFISALHLRQFRNTICNICKRASGLQVTGKKLSQYLHQAEIDRRSPLCSAAVPVPCLPQGKCHLTFLADFLSSLSSPAASVVSRPSYQTQSAIWQQAKCTACDIKMRTLLPSKAHFWNLQCKHTQNAAMQTDRSDHLSPPSYPRSFFFIGSSLTVVLRTANRSEPV